MATKSVMDQIVNSLAFVVEATPQDNAEQLASKSNITPLNLKVRVRKKTECDIEHGVISIPKNNSSNDAPERIRLISSDQTIMSFNVLMEADLVKKPKRKRKHFFGCLGTQYGDDDDNDTYAPETDDTANTLEPFSRSEGVLQENFTLSKPKYNDKTEYASPLYVKKHGILGKCKPGGCLDPPFSEDKYSYEPVGKKKNLTTYIPKDTVRKIVTSNDVQQNIEAIRESKPKVKEIDRNSILSLYEADPLKRSVDAKYSNSIITYPPETSSSTNFNEQYAKNRTSINDEKRKKSLNESTDTFFSPSKKTHQRKKNSERDQYYDTISYGPNVTKNTDEKTSDVLIRKNIIKQGSGNKVEKFFEAALTPDYSKNAAKISSPHDHPSNINSEKLPITNRTDFKNEVYDFDETASRPESNKKTALTIFEDVSGIHDPSNDKNLKKPNAISLKGLSNKDSANFEIDSQKSMLSRASTINTSSRIATITPITSNKNILRSNFHDVDADPSSFDQDETVQTKHSQTKLIKITGKSVNDMNTQFQTPTDLEKTSEQSNADKNGPTKVENKQAIVHKFGDHSEELNIPEGNPAELVTEAELMFNSRQNYTTNGVTSNIKLKYSYKQTSSTLLIDPKYDPLIDHVHDNEDISLRLAVTSSSDIKNMPTKSGTAKNEFAKSNILSDQKRYPQNEDNNENELHREIPPIRISKLMADMVKDNLPANLTTSKRISAAGLNNINNVRETKAKGSKINKKELFSSKNDQLKSQISIHDETSGIINNNAFEKLPRLGSDLTVTPQLSMESNDIKTPHSKIDTKYFTKKQTNFSSEKLALDEGASGLIAEKVNSNIYKKHMTMPNTTDEQQAIEKGPKDQNTYINNAYNLTIDGIESNLQCKELSVVSLIDNKKLTSNTDFKSPMPKDKSDIDATDCNKESTTKVSQKIPIKNSLLQPKVNNDKTQQSSQNLSDGNDKNKFPLESMSDHLSDTLSIQTDSPILKGTDLVTYPDKYSRQNLYDGKDENKIPLESLVGPASGKDVDLVAHSERYLGLNFPLEGMSGQASEAITVQIDTRVQKDVDLDTYPNKYIRQNLHDEKDKNKLPLESLSAQASAVPPVQIDSKIYENVDLSTLPERYSRTKLFQGKDNNNFPIESLSGPASDTLPVQIDTRVHKDSGLVTHPDKYSRQNLHDRKDSNKVPLESLSSQMSDTLPVQINTRVQNDVDLVTHTDKYSTQNLQDGKDKNKQEQPSDTLSIQINSRIHKDVELVTHPDIVILSQSSIHISQTSNKLLNAGSTSKTIAASSNENINLYLQVDKTLPQNLPESSILEKTNEKSDHFNKNSPEDSNIQNANYESRQKLNMKQEFVDTYSLTAQKTVEDYSISYSREKTSQLNYNLTSSLSSFDSIEQSKYQENPQSSLQFKKEYTSDIQNSGVQNIRPIADEDSSASTSITNDSKLFSNDTRDSEKINRMIKKDLEDSVHTYGNSKIAVEEKIDSKILMTRLNEDKQSIINKDDDQTIDATGIGAHKLWDSNEIISLKCSNIDMRNEQNKLSDTSLTLAEKTKTLFSPTFSFGSSTNSKKSVTNADVTIRSKVDEREPLSGQHKSINSISSTYDTITSQPDLKRLLRNISSTGFDSKSIEQKRDGFNLENHGSYEKNNLDNTTDVLYDFESKQTMFKSPINLTNSLLSQGNSAIVNDTAKIRNIPSYYSNNLTMSPDVESKQYRSSSVSSKSSLKKDTVTLNIGFQSYINDRKDRVIRSIDTSKEHRQNPDDIVTVIQTQIRPCVNEMRIPIDTEHDMTIQIKRTKSPLRVQIAENKQSESEKLFKREKNLSSIPELSRTLNKTAEASQRIVGPLEMQNILNTIYEKDLIPLQQAIVYLKKEVDSLYKERILLLDQSRTVNRVKPIRTFRVNQRCCCSKK